MKFLPPRSSKYIPKNCSANQPPPTLSQFPSTHNSGLGPRPRGSDRDSGVFPTYAYLFQVWGSPRRTAYRPAGSGLTHRPSADNNFLFSKSYAPAVVSCVMPVKEVSPFPAAPMANTSPNGANALSEMTVRPYNDDSTVVVLLKLACLT